MLRHHSMRADRVQDLLGLASLFVDEVPRDEAKHNVVRLATWHTESPSSVGEVHPSSTIQTREPTMQEVEAADFNGVENSFFMYKQATWVGTTRGVTLTG